MDGNHHDHQVRGIAMEAPHHASVEPQVAREIFDGLVSALDARIEEDEEVDPADRHDPEKEKAERAELRQWTERRSEQAVERLLDQRKADAKRAADCPDHIIPRRFWSDRFCPGRTNPFSQDQSSHDQQGESGDHGSEYEAEIDTVTARPGVVGRADELDAIDESAKGERRVRAVDHILHRLYEHWYRKVIAINVAVDLS